jgi:hypothetical protein
MNDIILDPPTPQVPKPGAGMKQMGIIMALIAAVALLIGILLASAGKTSDSTVTTPPAPVQTYAPAPVVNKYDAYLNHVYNNSGQANTISKENLITYGDNICHSLDAGKTIGWIVNYLSSSAGGQSDNELFASVVYGAITYLCDEYKGDLNLYLSTSN